MVYIHFPSNLTEEEIMLQAKYQKLKKKKKALHQLKAPKQEPEKPISLKRPADARDAREVARKLLKSGAIHAIQKPQKQEQTSFKRPKGQERKRVQPEVSAYQPFSSTQAEGFQAGGPSAAESSVPEKESSRIHNLYKQYSEERDREERGLTEKKAPDQPGSSVPIRTDNKPRVGNTIYVSGNKVSEEYLKKHFTEFGNIVNVNLEIEKGRGFITFSKTESADRAISEMHSKTIAGITLQVQLARRQPQIDPINDASSSIVWATVAASHSQKGSHKDKRELVTYDDVFS